MAIQRFEEILAWQAARRLVQEVYAVTRTTPFNHDRALRSQIERAAVSTMSNIAEGFERETSRDFLHFLSMARGSNAEVCSLLYVAFDVGYIEDVSFQRLMASAKETARLVTAFRKSIDQRMRNMREDSAIYLVDQGLEASHS